MMLFSNTGAKCLGLFLAATCTTTALADDVPGHNDRRSRVGATVTGTGIRRVPNSDPKGTNWFRRKPRTIDHIKWGWRVGADGVGDADTTSEQKFDFDGSGAGRVPVGIAAYDGIAELHIGPRGSWAWAFGDGSSTVVPGARKPYRVTWEIEADGVLGDPPLSPFWESRADASDPFIYLPEDLTEALIPDTDELVDLNYSVSLTDLQLTLAGGIGATPGENEKAGASMDVVFTRAGEEYTLLSIYSDLEVSTVTGVDPSTLPFDLSIYALNDIDDQASDGALITISDLETSILADLSDGSLDNSVALLFEAENLVIDDLFVENEITSFGVDLAAWAENAISVSVPEPSSLTLLSLAVVSLTRRKR